MAARSRPTLGLARALSAAVLVLAGPADAAQIEGPDDCAPAIAADPALAREAAARWHRLGGGVPARLCEAAALEALGAHRSAATLLTRLAENPNRALPVEVRATTFVDAALLWLAVGEPDLARAALDRAGRLAPPDDAALLATARVAAAREDWAGARSALDALLARNLENAEALALRAAASRQAGDAASALTDARAARALDAGLPEARFEEAAALAELGQIRPAIASFLALADAAPEHPLASVARANAVRLAAID
jgi:tetratricopeptide (TPR) repeat protein